MADVPEHAGESVLVKDGSCTHCEGAGCDACDARFHVTPRAPWAEGDMPEARLFTESECYVAGALSTMPPFDKYMPMEALPFARAALTALGNWEPSDG